MEDTELWNNFFLVGNYGWGGGNGILCCTPGPASVAIPSSLEYARKVARLQTQCLIVGLYVGDSGIGSHSDSCGWHGPMNGVEPYPDKFYLDFSGGREVRPLVTTLHRPKRVGWPARIQRVAAPLKDNPMGEWRVAQQIWWQGRPGHPGKRYLRAVKSMNAISEALDRDSSFLSAFRHGA